MEEDVSLHGALEEEDAEEEAAEQEEDISLHGALEEEEEEEAAEQEEDVSLHEDAPRTAKFHKI